MIGDGTIALLAVLPAPAVVARRGRLLGRREAQAELAGAAGAARFETSPEAAAAATTWSWRRPAHRRGAHRAGAARRGGTVLLLGLPPHGETVALAVDDVVNNDLTILGSFGYTAAAWRDVVAAAERGAAEAWSSWSRTGSAWRTGSRPSTACAARRPAGQGAAGDRHGGGSDDASRA